jgi:hypothetical protein
LVVPDKRVEGMSVLGDVLQLNNFGRNLVDIFKRTSALKRALKTAHYTGIKLHYYT